MRNYDVYFISSLGTTWIYFSDLNENVGREDIFKPTIGNESPHEMNNDNGVRVVNFATSKSLFEKSAILLHCEIK
jgi:hypothetical protein